MLSQNLRRGTAVIWTRREASLGSATMVLGVVQSSVDLDNVTIEVVEPGNDEMLFLTVPKDQVRPL